MITKTYRGTSTEKGVTLIELLVVIAIILIISLISVVGFQSFARRSELMTINHVVLGAVKEAQAKTLASLDDTVYGVHFETSQVTIFEGNTYDASDVDNDVRSFPARTSITNISLSGGGTDIVFERLTGKASSSGTVTTTAVSDVSTSQTITIYQSGLSEISG